MCRRRNITYRLMSCEHGEGLDVGTDHNGVTSYTDHDDHDKDLSEKDPSHSGDAHDAPPQQRASMVARFRPRRKWVEYEDITENEEDGRECSTSLRDPLTGQHDSSIHHPPQSVSIEPICDVSSSLLPRLLFRVRFRRCVLRRLPSLLHAPSVPMKRTVILNRHLCHDSLCIRAFPLVPIVETQHASHHGGRNRHGSTRRRPERRGTR